MSANTITATRYEIREGLTGPDECRYIEGVVAGQSVVIALQLSEAQEPRWLISVYTEVAAAAGTRHPSGARISDDDQARQWVELLTALYAKASEAEVDIMLPADDIEVGR